MKKHHSLFIAFVLVSLCQLSTGYGKELWSWNAPVTGDTDYCYNAKGVYTAAGSRDDNNHFSEIKLTFYPKGSDTKKQTQIISCPPAITSFKLSGAIKNIIYIYYMAEGNISQLVAYKMEKDSIEVYAVTNQFDTNVLTVSISVFKNQLGITTQLINNDQSLTFKYRLYSKELKEQKRLVIQSDNANDVILPSTLDVDFPKLNYSNTVKDLEGQNVRFITCYK